MSVKRMVLIIFSFVLIQSLPSFVHSSYSTTIYIITAEKGILSSDNGGRSWSAGNDGLPEGCYPLRFYSSGDDIYLATFSSGLFRFNAGKWQNISSHLFKRRSIYENNPGFRKISAFASDPVNSSFLIVATKHSLYRSKDRGSKWNEIPLNGINSRNYITAVSVYNGAIYVATSFNGIFELKKNRFVSTGRGLPGEQYSDTLKFTEQISYIKAGKKGLYAGFCYGGGLYFKENGQSQFKCIYRPVKPDFNSIIYDIESTGDELFFSDYLAVNKIKSNKKSESIASYDNEIRNISKRGDVISAVLYDNSAMIPPLAIKTGNPDGKPEYEKARYINALYVSVPALRKNIEKLIKIATDTEINGFVIDMKDDFGNIYFSASTRTATEINAQKKILDIASIIKKLKDHNIYTIARIVTFKDKKMFYAYNGKYAIKNKNTGKPWQGTEGEFWTDPYSEFVHDYNISLAMDLEKYGFDEIQFDYIRFPADGPIQF